MQTLFIHSIRHSRLWLAGFALVGLTTTAQSDPSPQNPAATLTIPQRVLNLEKKTDYYRLKRVTRSKTWKRTRITRRHGQSVPEARFLQEIPLGGTDAVVTNAWLNLTGNYTATKRFRLSLSFGLPALNNLGFTTLYCSRLWSMPAGSGPIDFKLFCQGVVNPQVGDVIRVVARFECCDDFDIIVHSLTLTNNLVNQVIPEPPSQ